MEENINDNTSSTEGKPNFSSRKAKILIPTLQACQELLNQVNSTIEIIYESLDDELIKYRAPINLAFAERGIQFEIQHKDPYNTKGGLYQDNYQLNRTLTILSADARKLFVRKESVVDFQTNFNQGIAKLSGKFQNISTEQPSGTTNTFCRLIIRIDEVDFKSPKSLVDTDSIVTFDNKPYGSLYCSVRVADLDFDFYSIEVEKMLIIDSVQSLNMPDFKRCCASIRKSFALLCGEYHKSNVFYITSKVEDFSILNSVGYEMEEKTIIGGISLINPQLFFEYYKSIASHELKESLKMYHRFLQRQTFDRLCTLVYSNPEVEAIVSLILTGIVNLNSVQQGAIYSVALESLANVIAQKGNKGLKPISDKKVSNQLISDLLQTLSTYENHIGSDSIAILRKRIQNLNLQTNSDRLLMPFELYGINLSDSEKQTINRRNDFLHGRLPPENEVERKRISFELHHLIGCLLLKYVGYNGYVMNMSKQFIAKKIVEEDGFLPKFNLAEAKTLNEIRTLLEKGQKDEAGKAIENSKNIADAYIIYADAYKNLVRII